MRIRDKETAKLYRLNNKGKIREKNKKWREDHPDKVVEYRNKDRLRPLRLERTMFYNAKGRAPKMYLEFSLELADIIIPEFCPLLPHIRLNQSGQERYTLGPNSPTLDRKDNSKGYTKDNVWVISWQANTVKNSLSLEELETLVCNLRTHSQTEDGGCHGSEEDESDVHG